MQDFLNAVQRGIRRDGARLYPAMPFTSYTYMTDADALAIKAYLFSLPAVHAEQSPEHFCVSVQSALDDDILVVAVQRRHALSSPTPRESAEWNRGAYIAEALAHCGECHTPRNFAFALDNRKKFAGARDGRLACLQHHLRQGHRHRRLERRRDSRLSVDRSCDRGRGTAAGPMGEAVDQSFSQMAPADIHAMVSLPAQRSAGHVVRAGDDRAAGAAHRPNNGGAVADLAGRKVFEGPASVATTGPE